MTFQTVLHQYSEHISRICQKAWDRAEGKRTPAQQKGIAWYTAAAERVQALADAPTPAWVGATGKFVRL